MPLNTMYIDSLQLANITYIYHLHFYNKYRLEIFYVALNECSYVATYH